MKSTSPNVDLETSVLWSKHTASAGARSISIFSHQFSAQSTSSVPPPEHSPFLEIVFPLISVSDATILSNRSCSLSHWPWSAVNKTKIIIFKKKIP